MQTWKRRFLQMKARAEEDPSQIAARHRVGGQSDVGLVQYAPSGLTDQVLSSVMIRGNGDIELFAEDRVGIIIDRQTRAVSIFGDALNLYGSSINLYSNPDGLRWNKYVMNLKPVLYGVTSIGQTVISEGTILPNNTTTEDTSQSIGVLSPESIILSVKERNEYITSIVQAMAHGAFNICDMSSNILGDHSIDVSTALQKVAETNSLKVSGEIPATLSKQEMDALGMIQVVLGNKSNIFTNMASTILKCINSFGGWSIRWQ